MYQKEYESLKKESKKKEIRRLKINIWMDCFILFFSVILFGLFVMSVTILNISDSFLFLYSFVLLLFLSVFERIKVNLLEKKSKILEEIINTKEMIELDNVDEKMLKEFRKEDL